MISPGDLSGKSFKLLMQQFHELRIDVYLKDNSSNELQQKLESIKNELLDLLEDKKRTSKMEIQRADNKKSNLIKRLVLLEKIKDRNAEDEIIKELEEYSRIRRYRDAQLVRINKEIEDIKLTKSEYKEEVARKQNKVSASDARLSI
ncbi:MAG: hypothetical protein HYX61_02535 [Gammaproteobacteria bacterium]|jgi:hypothetical protein|nr:hypothetical protein [Gammaproteobacteria bacterium]